MRTDSLAATGLRFLLLVLAAVLLDMMFPEPSQAWGPGAHMVAGNWVLQNLSVLPPLIATALINYPGQFLHGSLSADIFIGKGSKAARGHSHNWESGFVLLERARGMQKQAYAYGYLAHLAADTVAHTVYVPGLMPFLPGTGRLSHVYLESQADRLLAWDSADALGVFHEKSSRRAAAMLRLSMRQRSLPFLVKSLVYRRSIALGGTVLWRKSLEKLDRLFPECAQRDLVDALLVLSARAIVDVLQKGRDSAVLELDPIGAHALSEASARRVALSPAVDGRGRFDTQHPGRVDDAMTLPVPPVLESLPPVCSMEHRFAL